MTTAIPTIWGATRTTTFFTTATAVPGDVVYLQFPTLSSSPPLEYTTLPSPTDPSIKLFPNGQPILVITQVDGVIINPQSQILSTATIVQAAPPLYPTDTDGGKLALVQPSSHWSNWTSGQRDGVIAAIVLSILLLIGLCIYASMIRRKRKKIQKDMEKGYRIPRRKSGLKQRWTGLFSNRKSKPREGGRRIEGIERIELGPAASRAVDGNPSSAPTARQSVRTRDRLPSQQVSSSTAPNVRDPATREPLDRDRSSRGVPPTRTIRSMARTADQTELAEAEPQQERTIRSVARDSDRRRASDRQTVEGRP
ncbi:MAG: hypothetical protein M1812_001211 [Candelaria pacifica]|nr:MAG: hypothetical protein M1812_001211 [Candelaria pacifica]